jgi:dihydroxyacetone kinase-like protein
MKETLNLEDFKTIMAGINNTIQENKIVLSKLDSVIGDGDHGITIAKGLEAAMEKLEINNPESISELLKTAGNAIIITIGGSCRPYFWHIFFRDGESSRRFKRNRGFKRPVSDV